MSSVQAKHRGHKQGGLPQPGKKKDAVFYIMAVAAVIIALVFAPKVIGMSGMSFLADGAGLNKLLTFVVAAGLGWLCLLPAQGYKNFVDLAKGARIEWRKTVKPDRDTVIRTTMMVMAIVFLFAMLVLVLDWLFGSIVRIVVN
ncbi:MAG: preprotein translocase subunit SecE [Gammaproteobacteria bacterium]|nr:MAG: preprotein translocase subunit SecE [Gammaproteobacteria bacterium]